MRDDTSLSAELYGVGVGPGDPGLLTIEAARVLAAVDLVFAPAPRDGAESLAAEIAREAGVNMSALRLASFPMSRDPGELRDAWAASARLVTEELARHKSVAFITLGDPSVYSTWTYLRRAVEAQRPGTSIRVLPGVTALSAAAAGLGLPLVEGDERLALLPLPERVSDLDAFLPLVDALGIYKIGPRLGELAAYLRSKGLESSSYLATGVGLARERLSPFIDVGTRPGQTEGYLSLALVKTGAIR